MRKSATVCEMSLQNEVCEVCESATVCEMRKSTTVCELTLRNGLCEVRKSTTICKMRIVEWPKDNYVGQLSPVGERLKMLCSPQCGRAENGPPRGIQKRILNGDAGNVRGILLVADLYSYRHAGNGVLLLHFPRPRPIAAGGIYPRLQMF